MLCAGFGVESLFINWATVISWSLRLFFYMFGPWMKVLDIFVISSFYKIDDELKESGTTNEPVIEKIFQTKRLIYGRQLAQRAFEDGMKLKDLRAQKFGKYSELIPSTGSFQYRDIALPESYAVPYEEKEDPNKVEVNIPGQKLCGNMIHTTWVKGNV